MYKIVEVNGADVQEYTFDTLEDMLRYKLDQDKEYEFWFNNTAKVDIKARNRFGGVDIYV